MFSIKPYNLDWGNITPEAYNEEKKEILHIMNFDISKDDNIDRCIIFLCGKIVWSNMQVPVGINQKIIFDLRGQPLIFLNRAKRMKVDILNYIKRDSNINLVIEIII